MEEDKIFVDGQWVTGGGKAFKSFNPATGECVWQGNTASEKDVEMAVEAARDALEFWQRKSFDQRVVYIEEFCKRLSQQRDKFAELISRENGKPRWEALTEVQAMVHKGAISIRAHQDRCQEISAPLAEATRFTRFKPQGVLAVLGPFNLPGHLPNGHIIPALLAGNTICFKPSELTPFVGQQLIKLWEEAGLPEGVMNLVQGSRETGELLIKHRDINGVLFTGSNKVGSQIHKLFGGHPEKLLALEMGGNNPLILTHVEDPKAAIYLTIQSAFMTSGQRCVCARRLIVPDDQFGDAFLMQLVESTKRIRIGAYVDEPEPFMGPVISEAAAKQLLDWQEMLLKNGAKVLLKMTSLNNIPNMLTPGILDVTHTVDRPDEEIFGPLLRVIRVHDLDHAIVEANQTRYGLSAGIISDRRESYELFLAKSRAGIVNWNRQITGASSEAPFGGIGLSGNHNPSAYFAADYCSYPVASIEMEKLEMPEKLTPGIDVGNRG